jgi:hypothetical protein
LPQSCELTICCNSLLWQFWNYLNSRLHVRIVMFIKSRVIWNVNANASRGMLN